MTGSIRWPKASEVAQDWLSAPARAAWSVVVVLWAVTSATWATSLPSPCKTWEISKPYILAPFEKRGELDQGILRFTWYSLVRVAKGYSLAILIGTPLGFLLGMSKLFAKSFDPDHSDLRPVSPLAWLPLGLVLFQKPEPAGDLHDRDVLDVADRAQHRARRALHSAGLSERGQGAAALAAARRCSRSCSPRRCPTCSPASGSASASPGW